MGKWKKQPQDAWSNKWMRRHLFKQGDLCGICGKRIENMKDATLDHKIPISRGGSDRPENLQLAHDWCNLEKGSGIDLHEDQ